MKLEEIIRRNIKRVVNEGLSSVLYHFTTFDHLYDMVRSNCLQLSNTAFHFNRDMSNGHVSGVCDIPTKQPYFASFSRSRNPEEGYGANLLVSHSQSEIVRIEFDGDKLSHQYSGRPLDFYRDGFDYDVDNLKHNPKTSLEWARYEDQKSHEWDEMEDRLLSMKPEISNITDYITRIDAMVPLEPQNIYHILNADKAWTDKIHWYLNWEDFKYQTPHTCNISNYLRRHYRDFYDPDDKEMKPIDYTVTDEDLLQAASELSLFLSLYYVDYKGLNVINDGELIISDIQKRATPYLPTASEAVIKNIQENGDIIIRGPLKNEWSDKQLVFSKPSEKAEELFSRYRFMYLTEPSSSVVKVMKNYLKSEKINTFAEFMQKILQNK